MPKYLEGEWRNRSHTREYKQKKWAEAEPERKAVRDAKASARAAKRYENDAEYRKRTKETARRNKLRREYGTDAATVEKMLLAQGNRCAICYGDFAELKVNIDHCHNSKVVRGVLCHHCNLGIGHFKDDPQLLENAIAYLRRTSNGSATRTD